MGMELSLDEQVSSTMTIWKIKISGGFKELPPKQLWKSNQFTSF